MNILERMDAVHWTFSAIFGVLLIGEIAAARIGGKELKARIRSWWVIVTLLAVGLLTHYTTGIVLFAFISFLAFKEYLSLIPTRRADRRVLFWAYLAIPLQYWLVYTKWYGMFVILIPVYFFLLLPFRAVIIGETKGFLSSVATIQWGLMTTVFSIGHVAYLLALDIKKVAWNGTGVGMVLFIILLTELNDVAQFVWGKSLGRHKIIPKVSPNKTVEGFLGGMFTTAVIARLLAPHLTPLSADHAWILGVILPGLGFIGDVTISAIKRDIGVKDSGSIIPGHGGILDRIDSLTYTAPVFFHFVRYFYG